MEKTLFLTALAVVAVLGSVSSVPSSQFLLKELIRELEDAQGDNPAPVATTAAPSNVEDELANVGDLTGLKDNGGEEETGGGEGNVVQEDDDGETGQGGETAGVEPPTEIPTGGEAGGEGETEQGGETAGVEPPTEIPTGGEAGGEGETGQGGETAGVEPPTEVPTGGEAGGEGETVQGGETAGVEPPTEIPTGGEAGGEGETGQGGETVGVEPPTEVPTGGEAGGEGGTEQGGETAGEGPPTEVPTGGEAGGEDEGEDAVGVGKEGAGKHHNVHYEETVSGPGSKAPEDEAPEETIGGDEDKSGKPSELERSAVRMSRLLDHLSRMLSSRADILGRIDKVLIDGPEVGYPSIERLAEKQEKLEIMAAKVNEMKKVLSHFFDDVFDRFDSFVSDDGEDGKMDETKPVTETKPPPLKEDLPEKQSSVDVQQKKLLKRLLGILEKDSKRKILKY